MLGHPGFDVVAQYFSTSQWLERRGWMMEHYDYRIGGDPVCEVCGSADGVEWVHNTFDRFTHENWPDMTALCDRCAGRVAERLGVTDERMPAMPYAVAFKAAVSAVRRELGAG